MEQKGACLIEISHCSLDASLRIKHQVGIVSKENEACFLPEAPIVRQAASVPSSIVENLRTPEVMEDIIESGAADMVSICRPLIREPDLIKRLKADDRSPADCMSCGKYLDLDDSVKMHIRCRRLKEN